VEPVLGTGREQAGLRAVVGGVGKRGDGPAEMQAGLAMLVELELHALLRRGEVRAVKLRTDEPADLAQGVVGREVLRDVRVSCRQTKVRCGPD